MAIGEGIIAVKAALDVSKVLMDLLNRPNANASDIRAKVQELLIHVVNAQIALGEAQDEISDLREEIRQLKASQAQTVDFDPCPKCGRKGWHVESSEPDARFQRLGVIHRVYKCDVCGFTESKVIPPSGPR
jgi:predicted RNA-binding Zn-ribbon protein involved in translation (DUF1610 family)